MGEGGSLAGEGAEAVPPLEGELLVDPASRERAGGDFGRLTEHLPAAVLRPGSASDIQVMLRHCRASGLRATARGQGHSTFGQALAAGGLVIDMTTLDGIRVEGDTAVVGAGARWSEVLGAALARGRTPPVLTDYLELSVGGTLSAGGLGGTSHAYGAQVDTVRELEVVTGDGRRLVCSHSRHGDLFHAVLAGLGQCAIIVRATLDLVPAPSRVRRYQLYYPTVAALTADQRRVLRDGRFTHVQGQAQPAPDGSGEWRYLLEATAAVGEAAPDDKALIGDLGHQRGTEEIEDLPYPDFAGRLAPSVAFLESTGEWFDPHPWLNLLIPDSATDSFATSVMADLAPADIGPSGVILLYPMRSALFRAPLLRMPPEPVVFLFALLRTATPGPGAPSPEEMVAANGSLHARARALGGTRYPVGSVPMSPGGWRDHFGDRWADLVRAKRRNDPGDILTPGPGIFP